MKVLSIRADPKAQVEAPLGKAEALEAQGVDLEVQAGPDLLKPDQGALVGLEAGARECPGVEAGASADLPTEVKALLGLEATAGVKVGVLFKPQGHPRHHRQPRPLGHRQFKLPNHLHQPRHRGRPRVTLGPGAGAGSGSASPPLQPRHQEGSLASLLPCLLLPLPSQPHRLPLLPLKKVPLTVPQPQGPSQLLLRERQNREQKKSHKSAQHFLAQMMRLLQRLQIERRKWSRESLLRRSQKHR